MVDLKNLTCAGAMALLAQTPMRPYTEAERDEHLGEGSGDPFRAMLGEIDGVTIHVLLNMILVQRGGFGTCHPDDQIFWVVTDDSYQRHLHPAVTGEAFSQVRIPRHDDFDGHGSFSATPDRSRRS